MVGQGAVFALPVASLLRKSMDSGLTYRRDGAKELRGPSSAKVALPEPHPHQLHRIIAEHHLVYSDTHETTAIMSVDYREHMR
jgi:hypothetical protein